MSVPRTAPSSINDHAVQPRVVVVGYDSSAEARRAVEVAAAHAGPDGTVVAVHVAAPTSAWLDSPFYTDAVLARGRREREIRDELSLIDAGTATLESALVEGDPAEALVQEARARDADEIVVGARDLGHIRAALGSVSRSVLRTADRPVLVVPAAAAATGDR
jgi:nucleotide-binding universal stress UspA family protein